MPSPMTDFKMVFLLWGLCELSKDTYPSSSPKHLEISTVYSSLTQKIHCPADPSEFPLTSVLLGKQVPHSPLLELGFLSYVALLCKSRWVGYVSCVPVKSLSHVWLCNCMDYSLKAPLNMGFSRHEYWSGLPCPPPGDLSNTGIESSLLCPPPLPLAPPEFLNQ